MQLSKVLIKQAIEAGMVRLEGRGNCGECQSYRALVAASPTAQGICAECYGKAQVKVRVAKKKSSRKQSAAKSKAASLTKGLEKFPVLGFVVWWTISEIEVTKAFLEELLEGSLGTSYLPRTPHKKRAARLALEAMAEAGFLRKLRDDAVMTAYRLVSEVVDEDNLDVEFTAREMVVWDKVDQLLDIRFASDERREQARRGFP